MGDCELNVERWTLDVRHFRFPPSAFLNLTNLTHRRQQSEESCRLLKDCDFCSVSLLVSSRLDRIAYWAEQARTDHYCVQALARKVGVSVSTFERDVRKEFNLSPKVWLRGLKMQRACELLLKGLEFQEAAGEMGYRYQHHFSRDFKRYYGCSPTKFVALHRKAISAAKRRAKDEPRA